MTYSSRDNLYVLSDVLHLLAIVLLHSKAEGGLKLEYV